MDIGRLKDLAKLQAVIDNPLKSLAAKRWAASVQADIVRQLKDRKLRKLRLMLVKAAQNFDEYEEWKIAQQIKDYQKKEKMTDGYS